MFFINKPTAFTFLLSGLLLAGCNTHEDEPTAEFGVENEGCHAPCEVKFFNGSQDSWEFEWDFGDGTTSREMEPTHVYENGPPNNGSSYTVTLKATGREGNTTISKEVSIGQPFNRFIISRITLENLFPTTLFGGNPWDEGGAVEDEPADVYFEIFDGLGSQVCSSSPAPNLDDTKIPFDYVNTGCTLNFVNHVYTIKFYDDDGGGTNDSITAIEFNPFDYKTEQANTQVLFTKREGAILQFTAEGVFQ